LTVIQLDWHVALPACIMFFALQLDRGNIVQALSDNLLRKLAPSSCSSVPLSLEIDGV
jgi:hypothetical protein